MRKLLKTIFGRRLTVTLLLLLQAAIFVVAIVAPGVRSEGIRMLLTVLTALAVIYVVNRNDKPGYKIAWIVLIMIVPILGGPLYIMLRLQSAEFVMRKKSRYFDEKGKKYLPVTDELKADIRSLDDDIAPYAKYLSLREGFPMYRNTSCRYLSIGEEFFEDLMRSLNAATKFIFIESFIIEEGYMWNSVLKVLERKASLGVDVRVIYDDVGSLVTLPRKYAATLERRGIKCRVFNPFRPLWSTVQNNRDHRKITVIDGVVAYTGGINYADEYINRKERFGHWKDTGIAVHGDGVRSFTVMFLEMWNLIRKTDEDFAPYVDASSPVVGDGIAIPYADSPIDNEPLGEEVYRRMIDSARKYVFIATPYLILEDSMISALVSAAKSGVDVKIMMPAIPDKKLVFMTSRSYYPQLMDAGVKIYEYTPGFVHSKIVISDGKCASVGTANMDFRALYLHYECGVLLCGSKIIDDITRDYEETLQKCERVTKEMLRTNPFKKLLCAALRLFAPMM